MAEKCPCEIYAQSCCACVSMHCDECHGHSKFVQGRFCSNCGRPLKAESARAYVPMSEIEEAVKKVVGATDKVICEAKAEVAREIFEEIEKLCDAHLYWNNCSIIQCDDIAELKKKYTEGNE